jgi:PhnB protein
MIKIIPYLLVSNGKEAIKLYKEIFDAKLIEHQPFSPEIVKMMDLQGDFDYENSTMHAVVEIGGSIIYLADNHQETNDYGHVEITLELESEDQIKGFYNKTMQNGGEALLKLEEQEWGYYARIKDKFGVGWQLNYVSSK